MSEQEKMNAGNWRVRAMRVWRKLQMNGLVKGSAGFPELPGVYSEDGCSGHLPISLASRSIPLTSFLCLRNSPLNESSLSPSLG